MVDELHHGYPNRARSCRFAANVGQVWRQSAVDRES